MLILLLIVNIVVTNSWYYKWVDLSATILRICNLPHFPNPAKIHAEVKSGSENTDDIRPDYSLRYITVVLLICIEFLLLSSGVGERKNWPISYLQERKKKKGTKETCPGTASHQRIWPKIIILHSYSLSSDDFKALYNWHFLIKLHKSSVKPKYPFSRATALSFHSWLLKLSKSLDNSSL